MKTSLASQGASKVLSVVPFFSGLDSKTFEHILQATRPLDYDAGQLVILEGEPASGLFVVESGWLKVSKIAKDGREQILQFLGVGEVFNAVSVFTSAPNPASVTALEASRLWVIARSVMLQLLDENPKLARLVIQDLAGRLTYLISLVEDLSLRSVEERMARLILEQSVGNVVPRQKWATQSEIAARLGTVPDVVNRTLRKLSDRELIHIDRREIRILNRPELEKVAVTLE